jgi:hypothetical protein
MGSGYPLGFRGVPAFPGFTGIHRLLTGSDALDCQRLSAPLVSSGNWDMIVCDTSVEHSATLR